MNSETCSKIITSEVPGCVHGSFGKIDLSNSWPKPRLPWFAISFRPLKLFFLRLIPFFESNRQFDVEFTPFTPHLPTIYPAFTHHLPNIYPAFVDHFPRESHRIFTARSGTSTIELGCLGCRAGPGREGVRLKVTRPGEHRKNDGKSPCYENG